MARAAVNNGFCTSHNDLDLHTWYKQYLFKN